MGLPPQLSAEERIAALEKAKYSRQIRAAVKAKVKTGELTLADVFKQAESDLIVGKMRVADLLAALNGVGKIRSSAIMERLKISSTRRIQGLGKHQIAALIAEFVPGNTRGKLLVLSGPGGVGKSTIAAYIRKHQTFWVSVSSTTRKPRPNEKDGVDYYFLSDKEFDDEIAKNHFLEWAHFAGARYGTPREAVEKVLSTGTNVLLEIEIEGAKQVKAHSPEAILVFLEPPSWEELVSRLERRATDSEQRRAERLALAQEELAAASFFDHRLINDRVENVVQKLLSLASAH
ncbi:MAG: guanylate kinase [Actinobacteria bacterium]|nr:guanylate kinase [Actinomycetota bacterium]NDA94615.1 guanylate kinase [Actinomycetota bacterium]NDH80450.1 guanylate kinase [Actinomycetota bacterium]NDH98814.1 guanylate kinase [Actinomycetota bacterium]